MIGRRAFVGVLAGGSALAVRASGGRCAWGQPLPCDCIVSVGGCDVCGEHFMECRVVLVEFVPAGSTWVIAEPTGVAQKRCLRHPLPEETTTRYTLSTLPADSPWWRRSRNSPIYQGRAA